MRSSATTKALHPAPASAPSASPNDFPRPARRPLRAYAFDPSRGRMLDNEMKISVSYRDLLPGPVVVTRGQDDDGWAQDAIAVVDYDGVTRRYYKPIDPGHPRVQSTISI